MTKNKETNQGWERIGGELLNRYGEGQQWYIHYEYHDDSYVSSFFKAEINRSPDEIYQKHLTDFMKRQQKAKENLGIADNINMWSDIFSTDIFQQGLDVANSEIEAGHGDGTYMSIEQAEAILKGMNVDNTLESMEKFIDILENKIMPVVLGEKKDLFDKYKDALIDYYIKDSGGGKGSKKLDRYSKNALREIFGDRTPGFYKLKKKDGGGAYSGLKDWMKKLAGYLAALESISFDSKTKKVMTGKSLSISRRGSIQDKITPDQIFNRTKTSFLSTIKNTGNAAYETACARGTVIATKEISRLVREAGAGFSVGDVKTSSNRNLKSLGLEFSMSYKEDPRFVEMAKKAEVLDKLEQKKEKADVYFYAVGDTVEARMGITVKRGQTIDWSKSTDQLQNHTIKLQEGSTLLAAITRDLGYTDTSVVRDAVQLAAVNPESCSEANSDWNKMIKMIESGLLLTALAGVESEGVFWMAVSNKIFSIQDILQSVIEMNSRGKSTVNLTGARDRGSVAAASNEAGLERSTYAGMNPWYTNKGNPAKNKYIAAVRSRQVSTDIIKKFHDTKLRVELSSAVLRNILPQ